MKISISVLTYNRVTILKNLLLSLQDIQTPNLLEVIVTDNNSTDSTQNVVTEQFPWVKYQRMDKNLGIVSRNAGISYASGDIVITLDDDVIGIDDQDIEKITHIFKDKPTVGAVCFKVTEPGTNKIINWCHHYDVDKFSDNEFITNEITEGAVAFRLSTLEITGLYPETFFISHEGPDLACRILDNGFDILYSPKIVVRHYHSKSGRKNWRRYYYDTRNNFWFVTRNYPVTWAIKYLFIATGSMFIYSLRDGYLKFWIKGVIDGIRGLHKCIRSRKIIGKRARGIIQKINKNRPSFYRILKRRLFTKGVKI